MIILKVIMDDPGTPGQHTLNIIVGKCIMDIMDDPGAPGQLTLNIIVWFWKFQTWNNVWFFFIIKERYIYVSVFEFLRFFLYFYIFYSFWVFQSSKKRYFSFSIFEILFEKLENGNVFEWKVFEWYVFPDFGGAVATLNETIFDMIKTLF